jgi:DtxR family Mn-dependent transcriptional regulator
MSSDISPSRSIEEYLEAIYKLSIKERPVKTTKIAELLGVAPASVTEMIKKLSELGYIEYIPYKGVVLTKDGMKIGEKVTRRHRLIEVFLRRILNIKRESIHDEACEMEHSLSDATEKSLCRFLGQPARCPDGEVIPACDLDISTCDECYDIERIGIDVVGKRDKHLIPLSWLEEGDSGMVEFIRGEQRTLRRLLDMGLTPGTRIVVLRVAPLNGPIEILVRGSRLAIGKDISSNVFISLEDRR